MAFPATFNFNYYKGDIFEFSIRPKYSDGSVFDLTGYDLLNGARFIMSTSRGPAGYTSRVQGVAKISDDRTTILCTITPQAGITLNTAYSYVYDVDISKTVLGKDYVYTLLTGSISITDQVSGAPAE